MAQEHTWDRFWVGSDFSIFDPPDPPKVAKAPAAQCRRGPGAEKVKSRKSGRPRLKNSNNHRGWPRNTLGIDSGSGQIFRFLTPRTPQKSQRPRPPSAGVGRGPKK